MLYYIPREALISPHTPNISKTHTHVALFQLLCIKTQTILYSQRDSFTTVDIQRGPATHTHTIHTHTRAHAHTHTHTHAPHTGFNTFPVLELIPIACRKSGCVLHTVSCPKHLLFH